MTELFRDTTPPDPLKLAWFECNDYGNALRFLALSRGLIKWVDDSYWLAFDGKRWSEREGGFRARMTGHDVAQHIHDEVRELGKLIKDTKSPDVDALQERYGKWVTGEIAVDRLTTLRKWAQQTGDARRTSSMLQQAQALPDMRAWSEDFDTDPLAYNVENGTLRFVHVGVADGLPHGRWEVKFQEGHEPSDMITRMADVSYDPKAQCPQWLARLALVQPKEDQREILSRMYGQTLTGLTDCEEFYVHKGRGGDGKTKTHEIIARLHGDYYQHASIKTFLKSSFQKSGAEHRADLAALSGDIRMVLCDEPPPHVTWDGELLKQATGGGELTARDAGASAKQMTTFEPRWKLFVEVNPLPRMPGDDKGFRRRFRLVVWPVDLSKIPGGFEPPAKLRARLMAEKSGILNWLIEGCLEWLGTREVPIPQGEADALVDFWAQSSPFGEWLDECCDIGDPDALTGSTLLRESFLDWMERNDIEEETRKKWNATKFGRELSQKQIIGVKDRRGNKVRKGIRLKGDAPLAEHGGGGSDAGADASDGSVDDTDPLGSL